MRASSGVLAVQVSGALSLPSDHLYLSSSIAGTGIGVAPGDVASGIVTSLEIDLVNLTELAHADIADADDMLIHDAGGGTKKVGVDSLRDHFFGVVSGEATVADGGALTIANNAITQAKMADDAVGADELAANAVVNASVASGAAIVLTKLEDVTSANIIVGNASNKAASVAMSGDIAISNAGLTTIQAGAVEHGMLADDIISGQGALGGATVAQADLLMIDDGPGTVKKVTFSNFEDSIFGNISGDATIAAGGALTIAAQAVENSMLADDAVGADELAANAVVNASVASNAAIAASKIDFNVDLGGNVTFGNQSNDTISTTGHLTVGGNLTRKRYNHFC